MAGIPIASTIGPADQGSLRCPSSTTTANGWPTQASSSLISEGKYGDLPDAVLEPRLRAPRARPSRMLEENLYWAVIHLRWIDDAGICSDNGGFFRDAQMPLRAIVLFLARRGVKSLEIWGARPPRHPDEIMAIGRPIDAPPTSSASRTFLGRRRLIDATAYAFRQRSRGTARFATGPSYASAMPVIPAYC